LPAVLQSGRAKVKKFLDHQALDFAHIQQSKLQHEKPMN
jgi:hypothetical protein